MKKAYETPSVEKIAFNYRDQVVAASGGPAEQGMTGDSSNPYQQYYEKFWDAVEQIWKYIFG